MVQTKRTPRKSASMVDVGIAIDGLPDENSFDFQRVGRSIDREMAKQISNGDEASLRAHDVLERIRPSFNIGGEATRPRVYSMPAGTVDYDAFECVSRLVPYAELSVAVSRGSSAVVCDDVNDPAYYNRVETLIKAGKIQRQILTHEDMGRQADNRYAVELDDSEYIRDMSSGYKTATERASAVMSSDMPVRSAGIDIQTENESDFEKGEM